MRPRYRNLRLRHVARFARAPRSRTPAFSERLFEGSRLGVTVCTAPVMISVMIDVASLKEPHRHSREIARVRQRFIHVYGAVTIVPPTVPAGLRRCNHSEAGCGGN